VDAVTLNTLADLGFAAGLILILIGGFRGWWIYGPLHDRAVHDITVDRNFWRDMALGSLHVAERTTEALPPKAERDA
jgi:hypothetical protein